MEWLALAIFASTVLLIIDRNQKWKAFAKVCAILIVLTMLGIGGLWYVDYRGAKRSALTKTIADYVQIYGSCPGGEQPDYHLDNPCRNSVIPDRSTWRKDCKNAGDVFDQVDCEDAEGKKAADSIGWDDKKSTTAAPASPASKIPAKPASNR